MPQLPASVRLALWVTRAWAGGGDVADAVRRAAPDLDHVGGDLDRLLSWQDLGETALLACLPAPGDLTGMPGASPAVLGAAAAAGECVYVPGLGGMLVPCLQSFGSGAGPLDRGTRVDWVAHEADPVPTHVVEALDGAQLERSLRECLAAATDQLSAVGGQPFAGRAARELADAALGGRWALPPGLPPRPARVITLAGTVLTAAEAALDGADDALDATTSGRRRVLLHQLERTAARALSDATNLACAVVAGWRPA